MSSASVRTAPIIIAAASAVSILLGYLLLWNGGISLAASLLTIGYMVGIPAALLTLAAKAREGTAPVDPPPYRIAAALFAAVLALYVATLAPTTAMWDASEYIAAAKILGIPHPPGNPGFVLLAHTFALLPIPVSYAARVNLLAATTSAMSAALWFLVAWRSLRGWGMHPTARHATAIAAAWIGATCFTVWNQSVVNEKVYTVAMLGLAAVAWLALQWRDADKDSLRSAALLGCIAYLCGLGYTNHPAGFLPLPALGLFVLWQRPSTLLRWRTLGSSALLLALGLTPFLFEPIRAAYRPAINVGEPTACVAAPEVACTFSSETFGKLMSNVSREQYGGHDVATRQAPIGAQFGMWWLYFSWQGMRDVAKANPGLQGALAGLFLVLGLIGGATHWKRDRESFALVGPLIFTLTPALIIYLNFKYGASQSPELGNDVAREVRDRDYFYLWSFATWAVWVGLGLGACWQAIAKSFGSTTRGWQIGSAVLALALVPVIMNRDSAPRNGQTFTSAWARDLLESVEPNGFLITNGDNDSFPIWYAQLVEGVRPDVTIAIVPYLNTDWFAKLLVKDIASVPPGIQLENPAVFQHAGIRAEVPAGLYTRDQLMVFQIIKEHFPARPIHFSIGGYANALGLGDYTVPHGLTSKLLNALPSTDARYVNTPAGYLDFATNDALWRKYQGPEALLRQHHWVDAPSVMIPFAYVATGQLVSRIRDAMGNKPGADSLALQVAKMAKVTGIDMR